MKKDTYKLCNELESLPPVLKREMFGSVKVGELYRWPKTLYVYEQKTYFMTILILTKPYLRERSQTYDANGSLISSTYQVLALELDTAKRYLFEAGPTICGYTEYHG